MPNEKKQEKAVPELKDNQLDAGKAEQVKGGAGPMKAARPYKP